MDKQKQIIEAIETLAESAHDGILTRKPSIKDIESLVDFDIEAKERDSAWKQWCLDHGKNMNTEKTSEVLVTNNYSSALSVFCVLIEKGETESVPYFNAEHSVIAKWIKEGVISVK